VVGALFAVLFWSSGSVVIKLLLAEVPRDAVITISFFVAGVTLVTALIFCRRNQALISKEEVRALPRLIPLGLLGVFVYYEFLYFALEHLTVQSALAVNYLWPLLAVFFAARFSNEGAFLIACFGLVLCFFGAACTVLGSTSLNLTSVVGVSAALLAAVCYELFSSLQARLTTDALFATTVFFIVGAFASLPKFLMGSGILSLSLVQLLGILWLGSFTYAAAFFLWQWSLQRVPITVCASVAFLTPVASVLLSHLILGEPLFISTSIGLLLVTWGLVTTQPSLMRVTVRLVERVRKHS